MRKESLLGMNVACSWISKFSVQLEYKTNIKIVFREMLGQIVEDLKLLDRKFGVWTKTMET